MEAELSENMDSVDHAMHHYIVLLDSSERGTYEIFRSKAGLRQGNPLSSYMFFFSVWKFFQVLSRNLVNMQATKEF